jgi:protocatechuate 3,4-dioxygenase beta subunit
VPHFEMPASLGLTEAIGNAGERKIEPQSPTLRQVGGPTEDDVIGPYYRRCAPYRAKISPALAPGKVLVISGRIWSFRLKRPIADSILDVWQANTDGHYDNEDLAAGELIHQPCPCSM